MNEHTDTIDILMATYNAEKYLREQIDSILNQSHKYIRLIISDDNSTDSTPEILKEYENKYNNISVILNSENVGVIKNFSNLIKLSTAPYIAFSDHDDVWLENKMEVSLKEIKALENKYKNQKEERSKNFSHPLLVFTDKFVTDSNLNIVSSSHMKYEKLNGKNLSLNRILTQNAVSGCAMLINRDLLDIFKDFNKSTIMHDYYLTILAATFGHISFIPESLMLYRQHNNNEIGSSKYSALSLISKNKENARNSFLKNIYQAESIYNEYKNIILKKEKRIFEEFISLKNKRNIRFILTCIKNKFFKKGLIRNIGLYVLFLK